MAGIGNADREHSGHYLTAVAGVTVVVAGLAWFGQNRVLAAAAAALGLYALHLLSIRFLLDNQRRQRQVLDAQWEVLQRFIGGTEVEGADQDELVPAMPVDREDPERPATVVAGDGGAVTAEPARAPEPMVVSRLVPPVESLAEPAAGGPIPSVPADAGDPPQHEPAQPCPESDAEPELVPLEESDEPFERGSGMAAEQPVPRHFALGTVALVRDLLTPAEVARVLLEQRRQPGKKFGELAVEMGMLNESQREELLLAQQEGLFTDAEMREARRRLREFRENAAHSMAGLD